MRALALALIASTLCRAEWLRLETPGFEQIRGVFNQAGIATGPLRLRVFLFSSAEEFHRYRENVDGFYQGSPERDYIALYTNADAGRVAFHEYVHLVLRHSAIPLPHWFDEGMSEFYSTVQFQKDKLRIGDPIPSHLDLLARNEWLDDQALHNVEHGPMFYAESWALVHMLNLAPRWRDRMPQFVLLLAQENPDAFRQAFGKSMDEALAELRLYVGQMRTTTIPASIDAPHEPRIARIENQEAAIACAGLALALKRTDLAAKLIDRLPPSAEIESMQGTIALARGERGEAKRHLDRAIQLGSRDLALYFEYAMMERESGRPDTALLQKVISIDPGFADAHFLLGVRATDDGDSKSALEHLQAATRAEPHRSTYWHALAYAQTRAGQDASAAIRRAIATAETEQEERMAEALRGLRSPEQRPAPRPSIVTPSSWNSLPHDAHIEGTLVEFNCEGPTVRIRDRANATIELRVSHASGIQLINAPQPAFQFSCGPQNMPVAIDYERASGEVARIEFRL